MTCLTAVALFAVAFFALVLDQIGLSISSRAIDDPKFLAPHFILEDGIDDPQNVTWCPDSSCIIYERHEQDDGNIVSIVERMNIKTKEVIEIDRFTADSSMDFYLGILPEATVLAGYGTKKVYWDFTTNERLFEMDSANLGINPLGTQVMRIDTVDFNVVSIEILDLHSGQKLAEFEGEGSWTSDGKLLVVWTADTLKTFDTATFEQKSEMTLDTDAFISYVIGDSEHTFLVQQSEQIVIWDVTNQVKLTELENAGVFELSSDPHQIYFSTEDGVIHLWNVVKNEKIGELQIPTDADRFVDWLWWNDDQTRILAEYSGMLEDDTSCSGEGCLSSRDEGVYVWDATGTLPQLEKPSQTSPQAQWRPGTNQIISMLDYDLIAVWDSITGEDIYHLSITGEDWVNGLQASPDGLAIAVWMDHKIGVWLLPDE